MLAAEGCRQRRIALWQKLDPVLGSALIFLMPCVVLAILVGLMLGFRRWRLGMRPGRAS